MEIVDKYVGYVPNWLVEDQLKNAIASDIAYIPTPPIRDDLSLNEKIYLLSSLGTKDYKSVLESEVLTAFKDGNTLPNLNRFVCKIKYVPSDDLLFEIYDKKDKKRRSNTGVGQEGVTRQNGPGTGTSETFGKISHKNYLKRVIFSCNFISQIRNLKIHNAPATIPRSSNYSGSIGILDSGTRDQTNCSVGWNSYHTDPFDNTAVNCDDIFGHGTTIHKVITSQITNLKSDQLVPIKVISDEGYIDLLHFCSGLLFAKYSNINVLNMSFGFEHRIDLAQLILADFKGYVKSKYVKGQNLDIKTQSHTLLHFFTSAGNSGRNLKEKFHSPSMFSREVSNFDIGGNTITISSLNFLFEAIGGSALSGVKELWANTNYLNDTNASYYNSIVAEAKFGESEGTSISSVNLLVNYLTGAYISSTLNWDLELIIGGQTNSIL